MVTGHGPDGQAHTATAAPGPRGHSGQPWPAAFRLGACGAAPGILREADSASTPGTPVSVRSSSQDCCPRWEPRATPAWPQLTRPLLPQGVNELNVFVDLAFIFAGENDMDVDRVACFHDAVQGYSSLLYKLGASADFREFERHLKELWKALENDPHLPSKLVSLVPSARLRGARPQPCTTRTTCRVPRAACGARIGKRFLRHLCPKVGSKLHGNTRNFTRQPQAALKIQ